MKSSGERTSSQTSSGEKTIRRSLVHVISQKTMTTSSSMHATETHGLQTPCREPRSKTRPTKISTTTRVVAGNQAIYPQEISTVLENIRSPCQVGGRVISGPPGGNYWRSIDDPHTPLNSA